MADYAYGFRQNTNYVITSNTLYEIGRNYRFNTTLPGQTALNTNNWYRVSGNGTGGYALQSNGTLWAWGANFYGQIGNNSTATQSTPVQVGALSLWTQINGSQQAVWALQSNGTLWSWGFGYKGQLGQNDTTNRSTPVQVGALTSWARLASSSAGTAFQGAIQSNGTLWMCGYNFYGQLGQNDNVDRSSPVQVGALSVWSQVNLGWQHTLAIQSNGTLWTWGNNGFFALGLNTTTTRTSSPAQVGTVSTWVQAGGGQYCSLAIRSDGTLWACGYNNYGQLGINTRVPVPAIQISTFVQVGSLSTWARISVTPKSVAAIQSDGTLWVWGDNSYGQLGLGDYTTRSSPVQVTNLTNWSQIGCGYYQFYGVQSNGYLWTAGNNANNALGYDSTSYRSSAVQLGATGVWAGFPQGSQNNIWGAAINSNNNLYVWGVNSNRILNSNYYNNDNSGITIGGGAVIVTPVPLDPTLSTPIKSASIGDQFGVYVQSNGTLWSWGNLSYGQVAQTIGPVPNPAYMNSWTQISSGRTNMYGLQSNGSLWAWGNNSNGQLGTNTTTLSDVSSPVQISALATWQQISTGNQSYFLAIQTNGTLWGAGLNSSGQLGLSDITNRSSPTQVGTSSAWSQVSCGYTWSMALQTPGTLWAWGNNSYGQLGLNTITNTSSPVQVSTILLRNWTQPDSDGYVSAAIQSPGTLWTWGTNSQGQLGLGDKASRSSPVQVGALSTWTQVSIGTGNPWSFTMAIQTPGTLWAVGGTNLRGQQGLNTSGAADISSPIQVGSTSTWVQVACGYQSTGAIQSNGTLWMCGYNLNGVLGIGNTANVSTFVQVGSLSNWARVSIGSSNNSMAIQSNGTLWTWGNNSFGQLGLNTISANILTPVQVGALSTWAQVSVGNRAWAAIQTNNTLWTCGYNRALGLNTDTNYSSPVQVGALSYWTQVSVSNIGAATLVFMAAVQSPGTLWTWGNNAFGQLGLNTNFTVKSPVQVGTSSNWTTVVAGQGSSMFIQSGLLWDCGYNNRGQLGQNNTTDRSSPVQVSASTGPVPLSTWTKISAGIFQSMAIQSPGTLWSWGLNSWGQLGLNTLTSYSTPSQVGALSTWTQVSTKNLSTAAIQSPGTLWTWGNNSWGQLGLSNVTHRSSPVQVGTLSNWASVSCGYFYTAATQSNGTLWVWGNNSYSQSGNNTTTNTSSPVQVGTLSTWNQVSSGFLTVAGINSSANLYTWGGISYGQLGYSAMVAPIQISTQSNWSQVCCGLNYAMAVQNTGVLYAWGNNSYGQLGLGDLTHRSSLTQVGSASNWSRVACGYTHTAALQSNGTLWAWGVNSFGQLGQGNFTNTSTPVQVGTLSRYVTVYAMNFTTLAETQ